MGSPQELPKRLRLLVDVSGSMYRFDGQDSRLTRQMEAVLMVMEAFETYEEKFKVRTFQLFVASRALQWHQPSLMRAILLWTWMKYFFEYSILSSLKKRFQKQKKSRDIKKMLYTVNLK